MMDKRLITTIGLSFLILFGWTWLQRRYFPAPPASPVAAPGAPVLAPDPTALPTALPTATPNATRPKEERLAIERPGYFRAVFSSWGAAPIEFTLLHPQYQVSVSGRDVPIDMIRPEAGTPPFTVAFSTTASESERSEFDLAPDAVWQLVSNSGQELVYATEVGSVHLEKRWQLPEAGYRLGLRLTVENRGAAKPVRARALIAVSSWQNPNVQQGGALSMGRRLSMTDGECDLGGKVHRVSYGGGGGCSGGASRWSEAVAAAGEVRWIGTGEQFFMTALAFAPQSEGRACTVAGEPNGRITARAIFAERQIASGQRADYEMAAFLGPKLQDELDAVTVGGADAQLSDALNYTFEFVARPMAWLLRQIHRVTMNWGLAIIAITILLKAALWYPSQKSMRSAKKMGALKPEIDKLKERYGDDKQGFYLAQQKLFKDHKVSMFGGCLPMVLQLPIIWAFYSMLSNTAEFYRATFVGPINDLSGPFWPLALATGGLLFVQQRLAPTQVDSQQQKMMMYMMPAMFMVFTLMLPSGTTLYIFTSTLLGLVQQVLINRTEPKRA